MKVRDLRDGDVVDCHIRGLDFAAIFRGPTDGGYAIDPLMPGLGYRRVSPRQIRRRRERAESRVQERLL